MVSGCFSSPDSKNYWKSQYKVVPSNCCKELNTELYCHPEGHCGCRQQFWYRRRISQGPFGSKCSLLISLQVSWTAEIRWSQPVISCLSIKLLFSWPCAEMTAEMLQNQKDSSILTAIKQVNSVIEKGGLSLLRCLLVDNSSDSEVTSPTCRSPSTLYRMMNTCLRLNGASGPRKNVYVVSPTRYPLHAFPQASLLRWCTAAIFG